MPRTVTFTISIHVVPCQMLFESPDRQDVLLYCCLCYIRVYDLGKEIKQPCQAATFVSDAMLGVTYQVVHFQVCD